MDKDYYAYLTRRLDKGISRNPVVRETEKRVEEMLKKKQVVHVADVGCFSGSVINRIYENLPVKLKDRVRLVGIDNYNEALAEGKKNYPVITFVVGDLCQKISLVNQYGIVILSNVLHEVYSDAVRGKQNFTNGKKVVGFAIHNAASLLDKDGYLVVLDGIKSGFSSKSISVEFANRLALGKFLNFAKKYKAQPIKAESSPGNMVKTDIGSLAAFLTKARYLEESYWKRESLELYQYFTAMDFKKVFAKEKMEIVKFELQTFSRTEIQKQIKSITPSITIPAKNVLIVAKKI